jgi:preprotein translocase subunit SecG
MTTVLLVIHLLIAIALVIIVLLQPSEGGGLGLGGGGAGGGAGLQGFLSGRGTANLLTRTTAALAAAFMATSVLLTIFAGGGQEAGSILDKVPESERQEAPAAPAGGDLGGETAPGSAGDSGGTAPDGGQASEATGGAEQPEPPTPDGADQPAVPVQ